MHATQPERRAYEQQRQMNLRLAPARPIRTPDGKGVLFPREWANVTGPFPDGTAHRK